MRPPHLVLLLAAFTLLASAAAAPPGRLLTGIAIDPQGQPVAGAAVWLPLDDLTDEQYAAYVKAGPAAVTGADGRFSVSLPDGMDESAVDVCAPGSLTGQIAPGGTVVVRPGGRIFGQVVDAAGEPVAGMIVGTQLAGSSPPDAILQSSPCSHSGIESGAVTDATGRFTLEPLEPGWYSVRGSGGAVQSAPVRLAPGQALGGLCLVVAQGAQVTGRVTAQNGAPVPGATVSVGGVTTTTDAAGLYRLTGVPIGSLSMKFADSSHGTVYRQAEIAAGENRLDLVLPDPLVLRGRVLRPDGKPASGATVAARSMHTVTAADGTFRLRLPSGNGDEPLTIEAAGYAPAEVVIEDKPQQPAIEVRLVHPGSIAGRIVGLRAPAGTEIAAASFLFTRQFRQVEAVADAEGRFHLSGLAPGTWVLTAGQGERRKVASVAVAAGAESAVEVAF
ncbi:MAG TPA: carboxypeptidase-like regulatory domain-containing protein [Thermoanaerobaculia bacterium]|jgi:protocatechuate 3,4-dioxygenase beta subunit|nr:carboxypeptidase-like regulatory domain-containing protein [Thermoanaerobaculia bacterium]